MASSSSRTDPDKSSNNGRDNISIAFTQSQYPTPYTDHTIPGSTPGHRVLRLGRQHQPDDILYNHLSHALVAHGDSASMATAEPWEGNADHPHPPGGNYVLHTKNGGKRHYDELSGMLSEQPWQPSKRIIVPLQEERRCVPQRRGRGVYNTGDGFIHPDAEAAQLQREQDEVRRREHGGKAHVSGPRDHTLVELGLMQGEQTPLFGAAPAKESVSPSQPPAATVTAGNKASPRRTTESKTKVDLAEDTAANSAYNGRTLLPSAGPGVLSLRGTAAEADAVAEYHRDQRVRRALYLRKEARSATTTRAADVQSVRELPNW